MKGLVKQGNILQLMDVNEPVCQDDRVKVEVKYTGICGTDLHIYHNEFEVTDSIIIGHEMSGEVVEVGKNIKNLTIGDRVTVLPSNYYTCQDCEFCEKGLYTLCRVRKGMGLHVNGGFTQYVVVREDMCYKIPNHITYEVAAMSEPLAVVTQPIEELADITREDVVLVTGPGPIGLLATYVLVNKGCKVLVAGTSSDTERLKIAKEIGCTRTIDVLTEDLKAIVKEETNGIGVNVVVECSGSNQAIKSGINVLKNTGTFLQVGVIGKDIQIDFDSVLYKQLNVKGSIGHGISTWDKVIQILENSKGDLEKIITHRFPLSRWEEAFKVCEARKGAKVLIYNDYI
ncbi:zinc-dependent alcohol dehydrogenase [Mesobacillus maritimus]|uniref:Alcohol dehydrogenase catalytic domain-containing protein n=1 Tax=Mesobacillus maritimus TaxID=1643336 RepID=A0ABS7KAY3_9BACI|nr:alcohol dehydrogenase catalytic domain-containing protein [Mesobacillus maritimus]MBY0099433.1 alcohol dehydrogenase catalytic domain-containing protein [Mesobacillus maritimus]